MLSTSFQRSKIFIVASLCLLVSLAFLAPAAKAGQFVSVKKDGVNVRSGPNTSDGSTLGSLQGLSSRSSG